MTVLLNSTYLGYAGNTTVSLPANVESSLIAQGKASAALKTNITPGNVTTGANQGTVVIAVGQSSVTINSTNIDAATKVWAAVSQAAADGTLLRIERIVPANGSVTFYGTAAATANVVVDWAIIVAPGLVVATQN